MSGAGFSSDATMLFLASERRDLNRIKQINGGTKLSGSQLTERRNIKFRIVIASAKVERAVGASSIAVSDAALRLHSYPASKRVGASLSKYF